MNPICNWFLGTKSGLITALHKDDFQSYDRVFVLNPREGRPATAGVSRGDAKDAYRVMRRNVPLAAEAQPLVQTEHLTFYELRTLPDTWQFDSDGNWIGSSGE